MANSGKATPNGNRRVSLDEAAAGATGATRGLRETAAQRMSL